MWLALALSLATPSAKAACDAKALGKALTEAAPNQTGAAFADLAACDAAAAAKAAPEAFKKILSGDSGDAAALVALRVGAGETVRGWITAMEPADRSRTISKLGQKCDQPGVPAFFTDTHKAVGDKFWSDRWYRGLAECRDPGLQALLRDRVSAPGSDRTLFFGVLEVYSRNLGPDAVPALKTALQGQQDPEIASYLVKAFEDAAGVGTPAGMNADVAKAAIAAIVEAAPALPAKAVDQARLTLLSLGTEPDSDKMAVHRFREVAQASGGLLYGLVATEVATCKKGDTRVTIHTAQVNEGGRTWPDQLEGRVKDPMNVAMKLDLAASCKGTGVVEMATPVQPFKDAAAYQAWVDKTIEELQKKHAGIKIKVIPEEPISL
jgi:hypothetical protein